MKAFLHDLSTCQDIDIPADVGLDDVFQIIVSNRGFFGLVSTKSITVLKPG